MGHRPSPEPEVVPLIKAVKARIDALISVVTESKDGLEVYRHGGKIFLNLEIRRDHLSLDLWLPGHTLEEARSSGIARAHPFLGAEAVKVRFERAEDLSKVARWVEASYHYAPDRPDRPSTPPPDAQDHSYDSLPPPPPAPAPAQAAPSSPPRPAGSNGALGHRAAPVPGHAVLHPSMPPPPPAPESDPPKVQAATKKPEKAAAKPAAKKSAAKKPAASPEKKAAAKPAAKKAAAKKPAAKPAKKAAKAKKPPAKKAKPRR